METTIRETLFTQLKVDIGIYLAKMTFTLTVQMHEQGQIISRLSLVQLILFTRLGKETTGHRSILFTSDRIKVRFQVNHFKSSRKNVRILHSLVDTSSSGWTILNGFDCYGNDILPAGTTCQLGTIYSCISLCYWLA